jgi:cytochrome P450
MHAAFGVVIWIVCGLGLVIGVVALASSGKTWEELGKRGGLLMEGDSAPSPRPSPGGRPGFTGSAAALAERDDEIRQMLAARNARRGRRGEPPVDIEDELRRLTAPAGGPAIDDELRSEIRSLVVARNARRARRGLAPLDVDTEVAREITELGSL